MFENLYCSECGVGYQETSHADCNGRMVYFGDKNKQEIIYDLLKFKSVINEDTGENIFPDIHDQKPSVFTSIKNFIIRLFNKGLKND